jgi:hypothetical protein
MEIWTGVNEQKVVSDRLCAIYDRETREVLHVHRTVTLAGGTVPNDAAVRKVALEQARRLGHTRGRRVGLALVKPEAFRPGYSHRVDAKGRRLLATRAPGPVTEGGGVKRRK